MKKIKSKYLGSLVTLNRSFILVQVIVNRIPIGKRAFVKVNRILPARRILITRKMFASV